MTEFKFSRRPATIVEIESLGFRVEGGQAQSPGTGAWYDVENFFVANSATVEGERLFGSFCYLDDNLPAAEKVLVQLPQRPKLKGESQ